MSAAESVPERSTDPVRRGGTASTPMFWLRPAVLVVIGLAVTFTAALHEQLVLDRWLIAASLLVLGLAHLAERRAAVPGSRGPIPLLLATVAIVVAVLQLFTATPTAVTLTLAAWALVSGLCELLGAMLGFSSRGDSVFLGALGVVLATLLLTVLADPVAALGFFGAYAIMAGVYTAISAFDSGARRRRTGDPAAWRGDPPETAIHPTN